MSGGQLSAGPSTTSSTWTSWTSVEAAAGSGWRSYSTPDTATLANMSPVTAEEMELIASLDLPVGLEDEGQTGGGQQQEQQQQQQSQHARSNSVPADMYFISESDQQDLNF